MKMWGSHGVPAQAGAQDTSGGTYYRGNADVAFVVGQKLMVRWPTDIPKGATINSAVVRLNVYSNKDAAGSFTLAIRGHAIDDSNPLVQGANEWSRGTTTAVVNWSETWTSGVSDVQDRTSPSIVSVIQELVNRSGWQPGAYICLIMTVTAESGDMASRFNNDFIMKPQLNIDWSTAASDARHTTINLCENPNFDANLDTSIVDPANTQSSLGYWYQNPFFGAYVDGANAGTITRRASGEPGPRVAGREVLKFTVGTPPSPNTKATGPYCQIQADGPDRHIFCGWIYVPSNVTSEVGAEQPYLGSPHVITARDQWVPFCTSASLPGDPSGAIGRYFSIYIKAPLTAGWKVYLSEPVVVNTRTLDIRMMPWNQMQADSAAMDYYPGGIGLPGSFIPQHGNRQWTPKRYVMVSGTPRARSTWTRRSDGLHVLSG